MIPPYAERGSWRPLLIAAVVGVSFLFLLTAIRSPLIALEAGAMNLLAVGAAYGVLALAAEGGWFGLASTPMRRSRPSCQ